MRAISRRQFLGVSAVGVAAGYLMRGGTGSRANPLGFPIGCQTWPFRETIGSDFDGTLRRIASDGSPRIFAAVPALSHGQFCADCASAIAGAARISNSKLRAIIL